MSKGKRDNLSLSDEMNAKGIEFADRGWVDEAVRYFRKAIELDAKSGHAWDNLASVLAEKGEYREALACHLKSLEVEPEDPAAHYNLASFLSHHGAAMAESELNEALSLDDAYPDAHLSLGLVQADLGRYEDAVKSLRVAVELDPEDAYPRHELALLLMDEGDVRGAISQLREVVRLEPENQEAFIDLGVCYTDKGFYAEAERALLTARGLREDAYALYALAGLYAAWDRTEDALRHLGAALQRDPDEVKGWVASDPTFDSLRRTLEFAALLPDGD